MPFEIQQGAGIEFSKDLYLEALTAAFYSLVDWEVFWLGNKAMTKTLSDRESFQEKGF